MLIFCDRFTAPPLVVYLITNYFGNLYHEKTETRAKQKENQKLK